MDIMITSASLRVNILEFVPSNDFDNSKVVVDVHVPFKTATIIEDISISFNTPIIEGHGFY